MYDDLITKARELCDAAKSAKERGNALDSAAMSWAITNSCVPQLCDALAAMTARAEKAEAELDACKTDMRMHNDNLCETCKVENCEMRSNPPLSRITICFKHEWRGVKGE